MKKVFVFPNCSSEPEKILTESGFEIMQHFSEDADFVISVGGDGTFLRACHETGFTSCPILGINTGHLGFFTGLMPSEIHKLPELINDKAYTLQEYKLIETQVETDSGSLCIEPALNDVQVRHWKSTLIHLRLYVGEKYIESFSGDGILVGSSAGSTAYNYSLGGSIIDPRINLLQVTPIAPANNASYRCLCSSIIVPPEQKIVIEPEGNEMVLIADGEEMDIKNIKRVSMKMSDKAINIVRLPDYDFWAEVKSKML